jgi:hypothetical protein
MLSRNSGFPATAAGGILGAVNNGSNRGIMGKRLLIRTAARRFLPGLALLSASILAGRSEELKSNDFVRCISFNKLNVRQSAGLSAPRVGQQLPGAVGTIVDGPLKADGHIWWKVAWEGPLEGWSSQEYLTEVRPQPTGRESSANAPMTHPPPIDVPPAPILLATPASVGNRNPGLEKELADLRAENKKLREIPVHPAPILPATPAAAENRDPGLEKELTDLRAENRQLRDTMAVLAENLEKKRRMSPTRFGGVNLWLGLLALALAAYGLFKRRQYQLAVRQVARLEEDVRILRRLSPLLSRRSPLPFQGSTNWPSAAASESKDLRTDAKAGQAVPSPLASPARPGVIRPSEKPKSLSAASRPPSQDTGTTPLPATTGTELCQHGSSIAGHSELPLVSPPSRDQPKTAAVGSAALEQAEPVREELGRLFTLLSQQGLATFLDDLLAALRATFPDVVLQPAFHAAKVQELYFSDAGESGSVCYWRVKLKDQNYLLPRPQNARAFAGTAGFGTPTPCSPAALEVCIPARLEARGKGWEVTESGTIA